jgi:hypothetical protein
MVKSSQYLPSDAQTMFDCFYGLLPRERKFKPDRRPQERDAINGKERIVFSVRGRFTRWRVRSTPAFALVG